MGMSPRPSARICGGGRGGDFFFQMTYPFTQSDHTLRREREIFCGHYEHRKNSVFFRPLSNDRKKTKVHSANVAAIVPHLTSNVPLLQLHLRNELLRCH